MHAYYDMLILKYLFKIFFEIFILQKIFIKKINTNKKDVDKIKLKYKIYYRALARFGTRIEKKNS